MARTGGQKFRRLSKRPKGAHSSLRPFEKKMLKYYPKKFRIFQNSLLYQGNTPAYTNGYKLPSVDPIENYTPHRKILRKYSTSFLRTFSAYYESKSPEPTKIPHNIKNLTIVEGPKTFLKKLIKQNKGLTHISVNSSKWTDYNIIAKYLKFSKSLRSITFKELFPFFSEMMCRRILRNWANTMEKIEILGKLQNPKNFTRVVEAFLQFPKLKEFRFLAKTNDFVEDFPLAKFQKREIAYDVRLAITGNNYASLTKGLSECKPADCLVITEREGECKRKKRTVKKWKIEKFSKRILRLNFFCDYFSEVHAFPTLGNIQSLQLDLCGGKYEYSRFGQLKNLKHLSVDIRRVQKTSYLNDFFSYLGENVIPHEKLETLFIKGEFEAKIDQGNADVVIQFFEKCSKTLRKGYFELGYNQNQCDFEYFHRSLRKLKSIQSLTLFVYKLDSESKEQLEKLTEIISGMKSLEKFEFKIETAHLEKTTLNLTFPSQLKKLSFGIDTCNASFDVSKTFLPLSNLIHLEFEFGTFSSEKLQKILEVTEKLKFLEILVLKEMNVWYRDINDILKYKPRLNGLMKECLNLKLIVFAHIQNRGMIILRRKDFSWLEIHPIIDELPFKKSIKFRDIQSY